jgi:predicted nucleotidyltransferase component of viral defense system
VARLRDQKDDLLALVARASQSNGIPSAFVEKDFWVTEILRSVAAAATAEKAIAVFKGGTSLSKGYHLIERFSEDVDILLVPPAGTGASARHRVLKRIETAVAIHLGLSEKDIEIVQSTTGVKRDVRYPYSPGFDLGVLSEGVLLEMGVRGGPQPRETMAIDSYVAQFAKRELGLPIDEFEEFEPAHIEVLASERTLVEKLSLLHDHASRFPDEVATAAMQRSGRHYYDVYRLLGDAATCKACALPGTVAALAADVDHKSEEYGWTSTPRPAGGYAMSPAFDLSHGSISLARKGFETVRPLIYGTVPTFDECLDRVSQRRDLV